MRKSKDSATGKQAPTFEYGSDNIFKDLGFGDDEAVNLLARTELLSKIQDIIEESGLTQREAAKLLSVSQPRIAEIMGMKINKFSVDLLLKYLNRLGRRVSFKVEHKGHVA